MQAITPGEARIVIVDHPAATGQRAVFDALVERLRAAGHMPARYASTEELTASGAARGADVLVATGTFPLTRALMQDCPSLRAVVCPVTGTEGYDIAAAAELGILIANGQSPENCDSMAEATVMLMLALLYDLHGSEARLRNNQLRPGETRARMLAGKLVGLIGFGQIARAVALRLMPWGVGLQAYAPRPVRDMPDGIARVDLDTLLATSDIVSLHATLTDETRGMLDRTRLARLKPGAAFINTARGGIVDEVALAEIARAKDLRLALDVFATKPLAADSPLRDLPGAILTPHMVGHTRELDESQVAAAFENVTRVLAGRLPLYLRNRDGVAAWQRRWAGAPAHP